MKKKIIRRKNYWGVIFPDYQITIRHWEISRMGGGNFCPFLARIAFSQFTTYLFSSFFVCFIRIGFQFYCFYTFGKVGKIGIFRRKVSVVPPYPWDPLTEFVIRFNLFNDSVAKNFICYRYLRLEKRPSFPVHLLHIDDECCQPIAFYEFFPSDPTSPLGGRNYFDVNYNFAGPCAVNFKLWALRKRQ